MGEAGGSYFISMRYTPGQALDKVLKEKGPLDWDETLKMAKQIGSALDFAHAQGFLHRDVKPSNIIRTPQGDFVLTDFGFSAVGAEPAAPTVLSLNGGITAASGILPTPHWDRQRRVLSVGGRIVKRYRVPSPNQEAVLAAFHEEGWPHRIDDPLPPLAEQNVKYRLHFTIHRLNQSQKQYLIRFSGDGTGEGVCWELAEGVSLALPVDTLPKKRLAA